MKNLAIILAVMLLPTAAFGWDDRYYRYYERRYYDNRVTEEIRALRKELEYQHRYQEYRDEKAAYEQRFEGNPIGKFMSDHYFKGPKPPAR